MHSLRHNSPHILVVGDLMIDHYLQGASDRVSPEAPVPIVAIHDEGLSLGGCGNVVRNLRALGARVECASVVGTDSCGDDIVRLLGECDVDMQNIERVDSRQSSRKTRIVVANHQVGRFDRETEEPISQQCEALLTEKLVGQVSKFDALALSDYNKGVLQPSLTKALIRAARNHDVPVLVDPKGTDYKKYHGATLLTPNRKEAVKLTGIEILNDSSLQLAGQQLKEQLALSYVVITLSQDGLAVFSDRMTRINAVSKEVFDVSGAGDTVLATLSFCLASGMPVVEAAQLANRAAAVVVAKFGSATTTWDEILGASTEEHSRDQGIRSADEMAVIARRLRAQGRRIVFTNGCFDVLHRGHVEYLTDSRKCGDVLVVGINSDASVKRLKGPDRPVIREEDRASILAALRVVDYVVVFGGDTPCELISRIQPDVLTKGANYQRHEVVGADLVDDVRLISFHEGRSTTNTIDYIRRAA